MLYKVAKSTCILKKGGLDLRKFHSNSAHLLTKLNSEQNLNGLTLTAARLTKTYETHASAILRSTAKPLEEPRVLEVKWDTSSDELLNSLEKIASPLPTKRAIVSLIGWFYDL